jgi:hypothetical protein
MLGRNVIASKSYRSGHKGAVIAIDRYRSGNILDVFSSKSYCSNSQAKAITCNAITF